MDTDAREPTSRLLVPLDGSEHAERALPYALAIGGAETEVILLAVVPRANDVRNVFGTVVAAPEQVEAGHERVARQTLERAAARFAGRKTVQEIATGDAAEQILRVAAEHHVGLIVMTALGPGTFGGQGLGGVADTLLRRGSVPVVVVPASDREDNDAPSRFGDGSD